jgi:hypothetical protein
MRNILFAGKAPFKWIGYDENDVLLRGHGSTPNQGQLYKRGYHVEASGPSYRFVTTLGESKRALTTYPGGVSEGVGDGLMAQPSDRFWSKLYKSELGRFKRCEPKTLDPYAVTSRVGSAGREEEL